MFHGTITKELTIHEEWNHYIESLIEDQKDFVFMKFNGLHLKSMENLQFCISLRVCIFSNNFITDIHPLANCSKLIKLDLHGNQIKALPETKFWIGLKYLKLLYLHDNGFAKLKNICVLSACPRLTALTMFDCPVSLKKGYRHVLVNSIWSLKALDYHVISDEEIIQNWHLPERFRTCSQQLFFNFCPALRKNIYSPIAFRCYKEHRKYISSILPESKTRGIGIKSTKTRYLIPKGQKETKDGIEDEDFDDTFRVTVSKLPIYISDLSKDALIFKQQQDPFPSDIQTHPVIHEKPKIRHESISDRIMKREFFITQRNGMKLKTVCDVDQYYMEEKKQKSHKEKLTAVAVANVAREKAQQTVKESVCKRNYLAQQIEEKDAEAVQKGLQQHWQDRANYIKKVRERRGRFLEEKKQKTADRLLIQDLNNSRNIFSEGIIKANRWRKNTLLLKEKSYIVQQKRNMEKYQAEFRKQMKKIRAEEINKRHCEEKFVFDMIAFQRASERFQEAKSRVAIIKSSRL